MSRDRRAPRSRAVAGLAAVVLVAACAAPPLPSPAGSAGPRSASVAARSGEPSSSPATGASPAAGGSQATGSGTIDPARIRGRLVWAADGTGGASDVWTARIVDGAYRDLRQVTDLGLPELDADLAPDGVHLVYRRNADATTDHADLWTLGLTARGAANLTGDTSLDNWSPAWSPDGARIAFASTRDGGTLSLWTMGPDGSDLRRVTTGHGEYPDWSPDGRRIVYAAPAGSGRYDLWIVSGVGGPPTRITSAAGTDFAPAWSPDGRWIAYQTEAGDRWELWLVRPDGTDAHAVGPPGEDGVWPAWTPGGLLAWSGPRGVALLDVDTGERSGLGPPPTVGSEFLSWGVDYAADPSAVP
jgi:Tol biopolymer transport system component